MLPSLNARAIRNVHLSPPHYYSALFPTAGQYSIVEAVIFVSSFMHRFHSTSARSDCLSKTIDTMRPQEPCHLSFNSQNLTYIYISCKIALDYDATWSFPFALRLGMNPAAARNDDVPAATA